MRRPSVQIDLFKNVDFDKDLVICATARLANELRYAYKYEQVKANRITWNSAQITTYQGWLQSTYRELSDVYWHGAERTFITENAATLLTQHCAPRQDVQPHSQLILDAWRLVYDWQLQDQWQLIRETQNGRLLFSWFSRLKRRLKSDGLITTAEIPSVLLAAIREEAWIHRRLHFFGFESFTRSHLQVITSLERRNRAVT